MIPDNKISVWGIGYLGYSTILKLQQVGISVISGSMDDDNIVPFREGVYPGPDTLKAWSETAIVPALQTNMISFADSPEEMFADDIDTHILALPNALQSGMYNEKVWDALSDIFVERLPEDRASYLILVSAPIPGETKSFANTINRYRPNCNVITAFRSDWVLEDYLYRSTAQPIGGSPNIVKEDIFPFFERLHIPTFYVGSDYDAEVYHVFTKGFQYICGAFTGQFTLAYPASNMNDIISAFKKHGDIPNLKASLGVGGKQTIIELEQIMMGAKYNNFLSLLHDAQRFNLSLIVTCADYLSRHEYREVDILGITPNPDNSDLSLSPSLILAEALLRKNITVRVHDPLVNYELIKELIPSIGKLEFNEKESSRHSKRALILGTAHHMYREFDQKTINEMVNGRVSLVIDNTGVWKHLNFSEDTIYHEIGDGSFDMLS